MSEGKTMRRWHAERIRLGEAEGPALDATLAAELDASDRQILAALPPARAAAEIEGRLVVARAARRRAIARRRGGVGFGVAAVVALVLAARLERPGGVDRPGGRGAGQDASAPGEDRIKGDSTLALHRLRGDRVEELAPGARVAPGDLLQLSYQAAGRPFGAIISWDGRGTVTVHLPEAGDRAAALARGPTPLAQAYELDDAPAFERFVFVTGKGRFALAPVVVAARRLAARPDAATARLALPSDLEQHDLLVHKE